MNYFRVKNKKTGKIMTVSSKWSDGKYELTGANNSQETYDSEKELLKKYEYLPDYDYTKCIEIAAYSCKYCREMEQIFKAFARRLHSGGYFHVGDSVRLVNPSMQKDYDYYSHDKNFKILSIEPDPQEDRSKRLIVRISSYDRKEPEYSFYMYPDRVVLGDAFTSLERYDTEY